MPKSTQWRRKVRSHFVIPDTQCKAGVPLNHLTAAGNYIAEQRPSVVVHIGDHYDMPSLSSYDRGKKSFEGRRYQADIEAGDAGLELLMAPVNKLNASSKRRGLRLYKPRMVVTIGKPAVAAPSTAARSSSSPDMVSIHSTSAPASFKAAACSANADTPSS